jgi:type IV secretory pathway VirB4 component
MCSQGQRELSVKERSLVSRCLVRAFDRAGDREVFIHDILRELDQDGEADAHDLSICLEMFANDGPYAGFFDRPCESEEPGLLTVYELGEVAKRKDVASVLLMALIHKITDLLAQPSRLSEVPDRGRGLDPPPQRDDRVPSLKTFSARTAS